MHAYPLPIDKMPYDDRSYSTPELDYSTPEKNEPGPWSISSGMVMVDLSHPWGNDQPTWPAGAQPYTTPVQYMAKFNRRTQLMYGLSLPPSSGTSLASPWRPSPRTCSPSARPSCNPVTTPSTSPAGTAYYSGSDRYFLWGPGLSEAPGEWLVEQGASGFGIDTQALDHPCASYMAAHGPGPLVPRVIELYENIFFPGRNAKEDHPKWEPVHEVFLKRNIPAWENVEGDVDKVLGKRCVVRMVAFIDRNELNDVPTRTYKHGVY